MESAQASMLPHRKRTSGAEDIALLEWALGHAHSVLRITRGTAPNWHLWFSLTLFALLVWDGNLAPSALSFYRNLKDSDRRG